MAADDTEATGVDTRARSRRDRVEWPTVGLMALFALATVAVVVWQHLVPTPMLLVVFAVLGGFHMSLQHEVVHGHPTSRQWLNEALVSVPAIAWLPYPDYRDSHRAHHVSELTVPGNDPESFYVDATVWEETGRIGRAVLWANRTILGRMVVWPAVAITRSLAPALRDVVLNRGRRKTWALHLASVAVTLTLICGIGGVSWWVFMIGFNYGGLALTYLRSFAEHATTDSGSPCAVVRAHPLWSLLFLNNNLHHTHHAAPAAAWYELPRLSVELRSDAIAAAGAGWYGGYGQIVRRHLVRPFSQPVHPATVDAPL